MILVNSPAINLATLGYAFSLEWLYISRFGFSFFYCDRRYVKRISVDELENKGFINRQLFKIIIKRSLYIFFMGFLLNILPNHFDLSHVRILGVLQRIAICYFFSSILFLTITIRNQVIIVAIILVGYWFLMKEFAAISSLSMNYNLVGNLDQLILTSKHLYTPNFDPEGLLSTLPAIGSVLLGNVVGNILVSHRTKQQQLRWMITTGLILSAMGLICSVHFR